MANISTVFIRAEQNPDGAGDLTPADLLEVLLWRNQGSTYNVPLWERISGNLIDLQFGAKWGAGFAVTELRDRFGDQLRSIWARWTDDTDMLEYRTPDEAGACRCPYWFDEIRLTPALDAPAASTAPPGWSASPLGWRSIDGPRRRFADNCRTGLSLYVDPGVPTTTSTTRAATNWLLSDDWLTFYWPNLDVPESITDYIRSNDEGLHRVEVCWRGMPVETSIRMGSGPDDGWTFWSADDWSTCADDEFVHYFGNE
ncbi:hypothetical protein KO481_05435 [Nocardia sp. NEAU-G5]|uniref:Uncharacterized protein n=1 Tax=Nocardia albiluteola TaxID=2842303 RepID=A0ABS6ASF6_9NOCA|nr:hypothetical protein [Nocardia albiluteola]MBU3060966.1 hypothetical protein [Nocardia albiluteola]